MALEDTTDEVYSPLHDDPRSFRILSLEPGNATEDVLIARMSTNSLNSNPCFEALSYTWGRESDESSTILMNGKSVQISQRLEDGLRALRRRDGPRALWVDSICVNQGNREEMTAQIGLIQEIYQQAFSVIVLVDEENRTPLHRAVEMSARKAGSTSNMAPESKRWWLGSRILDIVEWLIGQPDNFEDDHSACLSEVKAEDASGTLGGNRSSKGSSAPLPARPSVPTAAWSRQSKGTSRGTTQSCRLDQLLNVCILALAPLPILVINKYAFDHQQHERPPGYNTGIQMSAETFGSRATSFDFVEVFGQVSSSLSQRTAVEWLVEPSPGMFVTASFLLLGMLAKLSTATTTKDQGIRQHILLGSILGSLLLGLTLEMSFMATTLYFLPWAAYLGVVFSGLVDVFSRVT